MPTNTYAKSAGPKGQSKPSTPKNALKATDPDDLPSVNTKSDTIGLKALGNKTSSVTAPAGHTSSSNMDNSAQENPGVNRKKQKRRMKEAARKAAEAPQVTGSQSQSQHADLSKTRYPMIPRENVTTHAAGGPNGFDYEISDYDDPDPYEPEEGEDMYYDGNLRRRYAGTYSPSQANGHLTHDYVTHEAPGGKAKKKKKAKSAVASQDNYVANDPLAISTSRSFHPPPPPPPLIGQSLVSDTHQPTQNTSKDRIWNTSTAEERERIKEFWLSLGEEERRSLVKVEKEAVLKKMKEQQKHSCSCTVCGRKRTAIEEELEVLYDAYYEELEQFAHNPKGKNDTGTPMIAPPQMFPRSMGPIPPAQHSQMPNRPSSRGRIQEVGDDEDGDDEDFSDEDDEDVSDDEIESEPRREPVDFFNFGNHLTVQGGILTVADDLLKNDGKKFIEMMEQLAERRMQREEERQYAAARARHPSMAGHNHGPAPLDDDGYDDDEEEYDDDSQEEEDYDEDEEMDSMTEQDRMEEGRRMFQIFAARMFEQRVLTAYREKVALERQQKLLEELDDESRVDAQREAKKAKEAQKKKDKKRQQKQAKDEEKARREAEKAAEEASAKALEEKKAEEVRQRKEEQRRKKEAEKKAQEEEKQRKEAEKQKRLQEAKEQQAEQERKQREHKEREKKKRDEIKRKEREDREAKEKEAKEKKERDAADRRDREAKVKADSEVKEQSKKDRQPSQTVPKLPVATPVPPGLHPPHTTSTHASPRLQIATPVIPKAPTPVRARQPSFQESRNESPKISQPASSSSTASPRISTGQLAGVVSNQGKPVSQPNAVQQPQSSQYSPNGISPSQITQPPGFSAIPSMPGSGYPSTFGPPISPMAQAHNPAIHPNLPPNGSSQYRNTVTPNGIPYPPGMGPRQIPSGRGIMEGQLSQISTGGDIGHFGMSRDNIPSQTHSRNTSASVDRLTFDTPNTPAQAQPIARPAPIKRPSSVAPHQQSENAVPSSADVDDLSNHLGSSALLDDTDFPFDSHLDESRRGSMAPGPPRTMRQPFGNHSGFPETTNAARLDNFSRGMQTGGGNTWSNQPPFGMPQMPGPQPWSNAPGFGRQNNSGPFGSIGGIHRPAAARAVTIRLFVRTACEKLTAHSPMAQNSWHRAEDVHREVQLMISGHDAPVPLGEMLNICETEGNPQNGGGSFVTRIQDQAILLIRFDPGRNTPLGGRGPPPGDIGSIGSPMMGGALPAIGAQRPFQQPGGF